MPSRLFEGLAVDPNFFDWDGTSRFFYYEKCQETAVGYRRTLSTDGLPKPKPKALTTVFEDIPLVPKELYKW